MGIEMSSFIHVGKLKKDLKFFAQVWNNLFQTSFKRRLSKDISRFKSIVKEANLITVHQKCFSFFHLQLLGRKASIVKHQLHLIDCLYDDFKICTPEKSKIKETGVQPQLLDRSCAETRQCIFNYMKHSIVLSNNNLVRNANALM